MPEVGNMPLPSKPSEERNNGHRPHLGARSERQPAYCTVVCMWRRKRRGRALAVVQKGDMIEWMWRRVG